MMGQAVEVIQREAVYLWYYFTLQLWQILPYWLSGMAIGSCVSVFLKDAIHSLVRAMKGRRLGVLGIAAASVLGIASPLCMYGTIPIAASFSQSGIKNDWLAAFMMSSVLLNPQLLLYSAALGRAALTIRVAASFLCGVAAGLLVRLFYSSDYSTNYSSDGSSGGFFNFTGFAPHPSRDTDPNIAVRLAKNVGRNVRATGLWFLAGVALSALFQRYVPSEAVAALFGKNRGFGVLMAATIGVPLYVCGGGTIPLLQLWLERGMSLGAAAAFMVTGPATKITNLGALKIVLGARHFVLYLVFVIAFSVVLGLAVNLVV